MAEMLIFPLNRRVGLIRTQAELFARSTYKGAENNLCHALETQRAALLRKGCDPREVDNAVQALEGAIRAHVWRLVLQPGQDA